MADLLRVPAAGSGLQLSTRCLEAGAQVRYRFLAGSPSRIFHTAHSLAPGTLQRRKRQKRGNHGQERQDEDAASAGPTSRDDVESPENQTASATSGSSRGSCLCERRSSPAQGEWLSPSPTVATAKTTAQEDWCPRREPPLNMHDLSFILHPSHEGPSPSKETGTTPTGSDIFGQEPVLIAGICSALGVDHASLKKAFVTPPL